MINSEKIVFEIISRVIGDLSGTVSINLESLKLDTSKHGDDRLSTEGIEESEIVEVVKSALPQIVQDFVNGEIKSGTEVLITKKDVNIVGALIVKTGDDVFKVITVRKKKEFIPKPGTKHYKL